MERKLAVIVVSLALLVLAVRSEDTLKCYMCTSLTNEGCDTDPKAHNLEPVECTLPQMAEWQRNIQQHSILDKISNIFEVDNMQNYQRPLTKDMACAKMVLKVAGQDVTVRSCQTAKAENIDPCKTIQEKLSSNLFNLEYCDLCKHDACNGSMVPSSTILFVLLFAFGAVALGTFYNGA